MIRLIAILRDPAWQMIGVMVTVLIAFLSMPGKEDKRSEISLVHNSRSNMSQQLLPDAKFHLLLGGSKHEINKSVLDYYTITNISSKTLMPEDIVEAFRVTSPSPELKIISVENCTEKQAQICTIEGQPKTNSYVNISWKRDGSSWVGSKELLNPNDTSCVIVISEKSTDKKESPFPEWSGRFAGLSLVYYRNFNEYYASFDHTWSSYLSISVTIEGVGIYWFMILFCTIFVVYTKLAFIGDLIDPRKYSGIFFMLLFGVLSVTTSEILIDIVINKRGNLIHPISYPLITLAGVVFLFVSFKAINSRKSTLASDSPRLS